MDKLKESKNRVIENNIDVVSDYYNCLNEKNYSFKDLRITHFWKKKLDKYECLPELIFLINEYSKITTFEIDLNMQSGNLSEDDIQFF